MNINIVSVHMTQKILATIAVLALVFSPFTNVQFASADDKIKICHATPNGYDNGKKEVDEKSITEEGGHNSHDTGGVDGRGDIIPPFTGYDDGKNWDATGQAIWNNKCNGGGTITINKVVVGNTTVKASDFEFKVGNKKVDNNEAENFAIGSHIMLLKHQIITFQQITQPLLVAIVMQMQI